uniref:Putative conserved secreted protein n=1 Tax=Rhipicephalus microplus TaxID=6941 RepID=A0A6G5A5T3_RHIMP
MYTLFIIFLFKIYVIPVLLIPLNDTVRLPVPSLMEVCAQCECNPNNLIMCRVNPSTGCYCVRGFYRLGEDGKCMERSLCEQR